MREKKIHGPNTQSTKKFSIKMLSTFLDLFEAKRAKNWQKIFKKFCFFGFLSELFVMRTKMTIFGVKETPRGPQHCQEIFLWKIVQKSCQIMSTSAFCGNFFQIFFSTRREKMKNGGGQSRHREPERTQKVRQEHLFQQ